VIGLQLEVQGKTAIAEHLKACIKQMPDKLVARQSCEMDTVRFQNLIKNKSSVKNDIDTSRPII